MSIVAHNRKLSGTMSPLAKRHASENVVGKSMAAPPHMAKKRPALANVTNQRPVARNASNLMVPKKGSLTTNTFGISSSSAHLNPAALTNVCKREILVEIGSNDKIVDLDVDFMDPQLCATMACDIYQHLRGSEVKKRPAVDFMEKVQKDINASMRAILIDWLVEVAEEYRLVPHTKFVIHYLYWITFVYIRTLAIMKRVESPSC